MTEPRTWTLTIPGDLWTHNAERNRHWAWRNAKVKFWRFDAAIIAMHAQVPHLEHAVIDVYPHQHRGMLADCAAHEPPAKAAIDGLIDARVLPDDSPEYLRNIQFHAPTRIDGPYSELVLVIKECP